MNWRDKVEARARRVTRFVDDAKLVVLNFSAGTGSSAIAWMLIDGIISRPTNLVVLSADPGMESVRTYAYAAMMRKKFDRAGIEWHVADGPNLFRDLTELSSSERSRIDNPAYFVRKPNGKRGRLTQKCTKEYKIAPMDRKIRQLLHEKYSVPLKSTRLGENIVNKWIGFTSDEYLRIKEASQKYVRFSYPLIDLRLTRDDLNEFYRDTGRPVPPRSVCNACFANSVDYYRQMYHDRPADWGQAVAVDDAVRDMTQVMIRNPVFVSDTLVPLRDLAEGNFSVRGGHEPACHSGYCFT